MATMTSQNQPSLSPRGLKRTSTPTFPAVEVSAFKRHAEIDLADRDLDILEYITAATEFAEERQNRCLRSSSWQAVYDCFPCDGVFYMPRPPLVSVQSIVYLDPAGDSQTLDTDVYSVDIISEPGRVSLAYAQAWPSTLSQAGAVTISFTAGYASALAIPARTRLAIRKMAAWDFMDREGNEAVPASILDMLDQDRFLCYR